MARLRSELKNLPSLVLLGHTIFSVPFAAVSALWAAGGIPPLSVMLWGLLALAAARNGANAANRLLDLRYDAMNPRLAARVLVTGAVRRKTALLLTVVCFVVYFVSAGMLGGLCLTLSPVPFALMLLYPLTKRFTALCHLWLGVTCAAAPLGAWLAVTGDAGLPALWLSAAVTCWVAGFDILYAVEDIGFDREHGLHSIPALLGEGGARVTAAALHVFCVCFLALLSPGKSFWYALAVAGTAALLATLNAKKRLDFRLNACVGVLYGLLSFIDFLWRR